MSCCECVRKFDIFGTPVSLKYKGDETFRTRIGGCITISIMLSLIALFLEETIELFHDRSYRSVTSS